MIFRVALRMEVHAPGKTFESRPAGSCSEGLVLSEVRRMNPDSRLTVVTAERAERVIRVSASVG